MARKTSYALLFVEFFSFFLCIFIFNCDYISTYYHIVLVSGLDGETK